MMAEALELTTGYYYSAQDILKIDELSFEEQLMEYY